MNKKPGFSWGWFAVGLLIVMFMRTFFFGNGGGEIVALKDYNEFLRMLDQNKFASVRVTPNDDGTLAVVATEKVEKKDEKGKASVEEKKYTITAPINSKLVDKITSKPEIELISARQPSNWFGVLLSWIVPVGLFFLLWSYLMRRQMGGQMNFGKSHAKLLQQNGVRVTFDDVAGVEEAKEELYEVIEFLKNPRKFTKLGGRMPKGCLLIGPPGTGKTLLARAVAGEANVPFFSIAGSDFVEMFVGVGASRVRDLFKQAQEHAPCIIFIDELDAIGGRRGLSVMSGGTDERGQTLNQLLVEMDGFEVNEGVILLSATNRPEVLDLALLRPGRFDRQIVVNRPDIKGREEILKVHVKKVPLADDVDLSIIARGTPGYAGADLANLINEAALAAARIGRDRVVMADLEEAKDKVFMGKERKSAIISDKIKRIVAYHETGHTLVAKSLPGADPVHKVTIIPRGTALGLTGSLPEEDMPMHSKAYLTTQLAILMGGRAAEEIFCGDISTGAANDIGKATALAHKMVREWGMSEKLGPQKIGSGEESAFLNDPAIGLPGKNYSEKTAETVDEEVKKLTTDAYEKAKSILDAKKDIVRRVAEALLEKETLDGAEIDALIKSGS